MKKYFVFISLLLLMYCKKSAEENCFISVDTKIDNSYTEEKPFTVRQILENKPKYLQIQKLTKFRSFKKDSIENHNHNVDKSRFEFYKKTYEKFDAKFSQQFSYYTYQKIGNIEYALAKNRLGFWLLKLSENQPKAYFLGLSFSHYYINKIQEIPLLRDGNIQFEGSLVKIVEVPGLPSYDDYSAMKDAKLFKINLRELEKDSDNDGYNDIFENCFGLNPNKKDTDEDGIDDYNDLNPLYKSEKSKFTELYEQLSNEFYPASAKDNFKKIHEYFVVYNNDCDYFHSINPNYRVLFAPEKIKDRPYYLQVTDVTDAGFSKIKKDKTNPNIFYISERESSFSKDYSLEYKNGRWNILNIGGLVI